ncbi:MAG: hypothetical protein RL205_661 [Actinomycetota bacterium]|jgi:hypothetical protein
MNRVMSSLRAQKWLWIAIVGVAIVVLLGTLLDKRGSESIPDASAVEPVGSAVLLCPEPGAGSDLGVRVTAAVVPGQSGQSDRPGKAGMETLPGKESAKSTITTPGGQAQINAFGKRLPAIRAYGTGSLAPGLIANQWGRDPRGTGRGMASTACASAGSDFWFVGGGAIAGRQTRVVLVNPDDTPAVVDVIVHGTDGLIDAPAGKGLVIKGLDRAVVRLDVLAPGIKATAVHVIARAGRVGASVADEQMSGLDAVGTDWIPQSTAPSTKLYVPGVMPGKGARVLSIVTPGIDDATVHIRVMSPNGTFAPADREQIDVPAESVVSLDMSDVIGGDAATLEVTSDVPVVAGMRQFFGGKGVQDETAFSSSAQPMTTASAVSGLPVRINTDVKVAITAPDTDVSVDIVILPFKGGKDAAKPTAPIRVTVPAGEVRFVGLPEPQAEWFTAVITPAAGSGAYLASHRVREKSRFGDLVTGYPWVPLRTQVRVPTAQVDPGLTVQ